MPCCEDQAYEETVQLEYSQLYESDDPDSQLYSVRATAPNYIGGNILEALTFNLRGQFKQFKGSKPFSHKNREQST